MPLHERESSQPALNPVDHRHEQELVDQAMESLNLLSVQPDQAMAGLNSAWLKAVDNPNIQANFESDMEKKLVSSGLLQKVEILYNRHSDGSQDSKTEVQDAMQESPGNTGLNAFLEKGYLNTIKCTEDQAKHKVAKALGHHDAKQAALAVSDAIDSLKNVASPEDTANIAFSLASDALTSNHRLEFATAWLDMRKDSSDFMKSAGAEGENPYQAIDQRCIEIATIQPPPTPRDSESQERAVPSLPPLDRNESDHSYRK